MSLLPRRLAPTLAAVAVLVGAATVVLGLPDLRTAGDFLGGAYATQAAAIAVVSVIAWVLILVTAAVLLVSAALAAMGQSTVHRHSRTRALVFAVCGLVLLAGGAYRHAAPAFTLCCGSVQEARELVH